ncbi:hypothetical protein [Macrococcoides canis]|uniref:hypothetical protein n=1 Tax=Macrococcoides canis TaxID=1855823 RepID=UPI0020B7D39B|nr:hypothetical protein [Macrococcus canis]UTG99585.1 hypothetical protein KFV04_08755 [Macrococcus canis]
MNDKIYRLQLLEEQYVDDLKNIQKQIDEVHALKQEAMKVRDRLYDKLQYLNSKGELYEGYHNKLDCILMEYHDDINNYFNNEIIGLENEKSMRTKSYNKSYELIMEEKDE